MKIALSIPGFGRIDSNLPTGVPTGGLFTDNKDGTGINAISVAIEVLILGAFLFALYTIIRGGVNMITSGGDKEKFTAGRERARYAIIGLVVIFLSIFLVNFIGNFFGVNLLQISK